MELLVFTDHSSSAVEKCCRVMYAEERIQDQRGAEALQDDIPLYPWATAGCFFLVASTGAQARKINTPSLSVC